MRTLENVWYGRSALRWPLIPVSLIYCAVAELRRFAYGAGLLRSTKLPVPMVVVGNLTVGGTGKTPLVIHVAGMLVNAGYKPGIVTRGYGGEATDWPVVVKPDSDPEMAGDESVLLARRCQCPVVADPDRVRAARTLLEQFDCDVLISDDGLQHFALQRDVEVAVVDGERRFGNGHCLPAGPLRERAARLKEMDITVVHGGSAGTEPGMTLHPSRLVNLADANRTCGMEVFKGRPVHAVAGIGYPRRFFRLLRQAGLEIEEHPFADHYRFQPGDLGFGDTHPILMTEKDAVKCERFATDNHWFVRVDAKVDDSIEKKLLTLLSGIA